MATTPIWVPLAVAFLGLGGILLTQYFANHREDVRWNRERDREDARWNRERDRQEAAWAHEDAARSDERTRQRLADSYLEVLRIVEREAQRVEASITRWETLAEDPSAYGPEPGPPSREEMERAVKEIRVRIRESAADQVTIAAHLAAFGSENVRRLYDTWRSVITEIKNEEEVLQEACREYWPGGRGDIPPGELKPMLAELEALHLKEDAARRALEDAMAAELGHR